MTPVVADDSLCIVCGDSRREVLQVQRGVRILADGVDARFDIKTALCASCGLVFTDPQPADELLERFYARQFRDLFAGDDDARIPGEGIRRDQVAWLVERLGDLAGRRILEIGCYDGFLLELLTAEGASCLGIEPCERAAESGRNRWGVEIITAGFEDAVLPEASFDLVVLSHVAEHLRDPGLALRFAHAALKPGGWLFVEVPNVLAPRVEHVVNFFTFDHLYNFSPRTLERLADGCGFEMKSVDIDFPFPAFRFLAERRAVRQPKRSFAQDIDERAVSECREAVLGYIAGRRAFVINLRSRVDERLARWRSNSTRIAIYGAGDHTERLLSETDLSYADVVALVDGDPAKWGTELFGVPVVAPERLPELDVGAVVISSYDFQEEMRANVARICRPAPELLLFYEEAIAFCSFVPPERGSAAGAVPL